MAQEYGLLPVQASLKTLKFGKHAFINSPMWAFGGGNWKSRCQPPADCLTLDNRFINKSYLEQTNKDHHGR